MNNPVNHPIGHFPFHDQSILVHSIIRDDILELIERQRR